MNSTVLRYSPHPAALLTVAFLVAGCRANTDPIPASYDSVRNYPNITLSQPSLAEAVKIGAGGEVVKRTPADLLQVTVPIRAASNEMLHIEYRMLWFEETGAPLGPEMTWTPLRLEPRQPQYVTVTASDTRASRYNLQLRWGRP